MSEARDRSVSLLRRGKALEWLTLSWNIVGVVVLAYLAAVTSSVALVGFGLDSLIEIAASVVVLWELADVTERRRHRALRLIGLAFIALAAYLVAQSTIALLLGHRSHPGFGGIVWTAATALVMFALAFGKRRTARALGNPVLEAESRVTTIDAVLAVVVLVGISLDLALSWWWADPLVGYIIVYYAIREALEIFRTRRAATAKM